MKDTFLTLYDRLLPEKYGILHKHLKIYPVSTSKAINELKEKVSWDTLTMSEIEVIIEFSDTNNRGITVYPLDTFRRGRGILRSTILHENK